MSGIFAQMWRSWRRLSGLNEPRRGGWRTVGGRDWRARLLLEALEERVTPAELINNGSFETGDFSGWTQSGNTNDTFVSLNNNGHSGRYSAQMGPVGTD